MDTLFDVTAPPPVDLDGDDLREAIHRHLRTHPGLTAKQVSAALNLPDPSGAGARKTVAMLRVMEDEGESDRLPGCKNPVRWEAT